MVRSIIALVGGFAIMAFLVFVLTIAVAAAFGVTDGAPTTPYIVANLMLKDHWGRARPRQVTEFGGSKTFTPPLIPAKQCPRNCSFVSGEAASIFLPFYAVAFVALQWDAVLVVAGTLLGLASGAVRVSQGAHFLSDVIFAGVFMALTVGLVYRAILGRVATKALPGASAEST